MNQSQKKTMMSDNLTHVKGVVNLLKSVDKTTPILILTHQNPDADTLGSAVALALGLEKVGYRTRILAEIVPKRYSFLANDKFIESVDLSDKDYFIISVDIAAPSLFGKFEECLGDKINLVIDHHLGNSINAPYKFVQTDRVACGELIYDILKALNVEITEMIAGPLYAAISSDSGGFRFSSVRPKTHTIAAELIKTGINFAEINRLLFDTKSKEQFLLERIAYSEIEFFLDGRIAMVAFDKNMLQEAGISLENAEFGGISQMPRQLEGVEVGIVIRPAKDDIGENQQYKVSMRSNRFINVSKICTAFGGGGHYHAAGCSITGDFKMVKAEIIREVEKSFEETRNTDN